MDSLVFKDWLNYEEGIIGTAYNYLKNKIGSLLNFISSFVIKSKKVQTGSVSFTFPKQQFNLYEVENNVGDNQASLIGSKPSHLDSRTPYKDPYAAVVRRKNNRNKGMEFNSEDFDAMDKNRLKGLLSSIKNNPNHFKVNSRMPWEDYLSPEEVVKTIQAAIYAKNPPAVPLEKFDAPMAGYLFEIECYLAIKNKGYPGIQEKIPGNYERYKISLQNFYEEIKKQAEKLADYIISESKRDMPCIDSVVFSGGRHIGGRGMSREDPADIKMICKDVYFGYSLKHSSNKSLSIQLANLYRHPLEVAPGINSTLTTSQDFAEFLNKMISEKRNTRMALGGVKTEMLHNILSKDFDMDPNTAQYFPKHDGSVSISKDGDKEYYRFGSVTLRIRERPRDGYKNTFSVNLSISNDADK